MVTKLFKILIVLISFITVVIVSFLLLSIKENISQISKNVAEDTQHSIVQRAKVVVGHLFLSDTNSTLDKLFANNPLLRQQCSQELEVIRDKEMPYVYLLFRDSKNKFRFLCDGSVGKNRFYQKFDIDDRNLWNTVYDAGRVQIIDQSRYRGLWKSILYPVVKNGKTQALLVIDYAISFPQKIANITESSKKIFYYMLFAVVILFVIIAFQIVHIVITRKRSFTDGLTRVYNRNFLITLKRHIQSKKYAIVMFDLDYFKQINDVYGHDTGDEALKHTVVCMKKHLLKKDYLIRYGGEEFLLLLNKAHGKRDAFVVAEAIRKELFEHSLSTKKYGSVEVHISAGVNTAPDAYDSIEEAIKAADIALYEAKKSGRNCVVKVARATQKEAQKRGSTYSFSVVQKLIDQGRVFCEYQPIFSNKTGKIVKYESLVRLEDYDGKTLYPNQFLDVIWRTNAYVGLTQQVIQKSIQLFKKRKENFTINLSMQDILDEKILSIITDCAKEEPETIKRMGIEILEYDKFDNTDRLLYVMKNLKKLGLRIILDDFGSGQANFTIVELLPIDELKIDGDLIKNINKSEKTKFLLEALATFAKKSSIKTTGEYIATQEIYETIHLLSIDQLQGFYLGKPTRLF